MYRTIQTGTAAKPLQLHFTFDGEKPPKGARGSAAAETLDELARALEAFNFDGATGLLERLGSNAV
jgi:hypothetical protein